jgi:hypothetical protein
MPWFRKSVYTDNTIILYFLCLTKKILLYYYCRNFPNGQLDFPNMLTPPPRYGPKRDSIFIFQFLLVGSGLRHMNILQFHPPVHLAAQEVSDVCPINTTSSTINTIDGLTDYSLLLNGLVSMFTYFSMSLSSPRKRGRHSAMPTYQPPRSAIFCRP